MFRMIRTAQSCIARMSARESKLPKMQRLPIAGFSSIGWPDQSMPSVIKNLNVASLQKGIAKQTSNMNLKKDQSRFYHCLRHKAPTRGSHGVRVLSSQANQIRTFFSTGGPQEVYNNRRMGRGVPLPMRVFGWIAGTAAFVFFIPVAFIIALTPPILLGIYGLTWRWRRLKNQLYKQRWDSMSSYHLTLKPDDLPGSQMQQGIPHIAKRRIMSALENDEQNLCERLGLSVQDDLATDKLRFTDVESIQQEFRAGRGGLQEKMEIRTFGLVDFETTKRIANIFLIIHRDLSRNTAEDSGRMRIEVNGVNSRSSPIVLEEPTEDELEDVVIDVKPRRKSR